MDDFYKLLNKYRVEGTFCDVALWAKCPTNPENVMGPYSAHKVVLAATCPSLATVMTSQNIALDAADSETMPVLLSWVYGQKEQAAKSITSPLILQRVKYLAKCLGMKSFMAFLSSVAINERSPPDVVQPEAHPILEKRSNSPKTKVDNAAATKINNNNNNNDSTGLSGAPSTPKGTSPRSARTTNGRAQNVTGEAKPSPTTPASLKAEVRTPPQRESQTSSARLSTIVNEKEQPAPVKETRHSNRQSLRGGENGIDLNESPAGNSQEADSTTEDTGNEPMIRRKRGQKEEQPASPVKRKRETSEDNNSKTSIEESARSTPQMRTRVENKTAGNKLSNLKVSALPDKITKPSSKPQSTTPAAAPQSNATASSSAKSTVWSASWNNVDTNKLKIPEDTTKYPFKRVREATVAMTCYCHICGKMKSGKDLKSHYEKIHFMELKDSYQVICLVEKAEDFLQKCKWVALKDLTSDMALDLVCGVCYVNKSGKKLLFKHLKEKHDVDVNEQNPDLELLVEKKMWEIDMDAVTDEGTETNNDFTTSWVKYSDAIANGTFQCHECDQHVSSKKAIKTHLGTMHNKELDEKEGSVLQVQRGAPSRKRRSTMGVRDIS